MNRNPTIGYCNELQKCVMCTVSVGWQTQSPNANRSPITHQSDGSG